MMYLKENWGTAGLSQHAPHWPWNLLCWIRYILSIPFPYILKNTDRNLKAGLEGWGILLWHHAHTSPNLLKRGGLKFGQPVRVSKLHKPPVSLTYQNATVFYITFLS